MNEKENEGWRRMTRMKNGDARICEDKEESMENSIYTEVMQVMFKIL